MDNAAHSLVMFSLTMELGIRAKAWQIRVLPMHWIEVDGERMFRADICVVANNLPLEVALTVPPLLCIEIISPGDSTAMITAKTDSYLNAGVKAVWEIHPCDKKAYQIVNGTNRTTDTQLTVPDTDILIYPDQLFDGLRELER